MSKYLSDQLIPYLASSGEPAGAPGTLVRRPLNWIHRACPIHMLLRLSCLSFRRTCSLSPSKNSDTGIIFNPTCLHLFNVSTEPSYLCLLSVSYLVGSIVMLSMSGTSLWRLAVLPTIQETHYSLVQCWIA